MRARRADHILRGWRPRCCRDQHRWRVRPSGPGQLQLEWRRVRMGTWACS